MADGDITHVKELGRVALPGTGSSLSGEAKNQKVMVWGEISGTWTDTNGLKLVAMGGIEALGVSALDYIQFHVKSVGGAFSGDEAIFTAALGTDSEEIYVVVDGLTNPTAADACVMSYFAIGDSNAAPDLT